MLMVSSVSILKEHKFASLNIYSICVSSIISCYLFAYVFISIRKFISNNLNKPKLNNNTASIFPSLFT